MVCKANISSGSFTGNAWKGQTHENKLVSFPARLPFSIRSKDLSRKHCLFRNIPVVKPVSWNEPHRGSFQWSAIGRVWNTALINNKLAYFWTVSLSTRHSRKQFSVLSAPLPALARHLSPFPAPQSPLTSLTK